MPFLLHHHLFSTSSSSPPCLFQILPPNAGFSFQFLARALALHRCLACLCTAGALLISPTTLLSLLSLSIQRHQSGCRSADNPPPRSALIRDKALFLSLQACDWPRPQLGMKRFSGLEILALLLDPARPSLTESFAGGLRPEIRQQGLSTHTGSCLAVINV